MVADCYRSFEKRNERIGCAALRSWEGRVIAAQSISLTGNRIATYHATRTNFTANGQAMSQPNIVLIFTDNQQASTLGCYGNSEVYTPNLNKLASQGMLFENAYCPNGFCSPCRASLLTGKLPSQHGVHSWIDDRNMHQWPRRWHALDGMPTLPKKLQSAGYKTALIGKYHLGEPTSPAEGFDHWVTLEDGHVRSFYRNKIFDNGEVYDQPGHSVDFFTDKAQNFMQQQVQNNKPFFLYLPYPAPYGHWPATTEPDENRHTHRYKNCPMHSIPRQALSKAAVDGFLINQSGSTEDLDFSMLMRAPNHLPTLRNYYSQVSMVDDGVGRIMESLTQLGIDDNTLLIFTADHGLSMGQHGFWGHGGACFPSNLHNAAHSVPLIIQSKGSIEAGRKSQLMVSNMDLYSTILDYAGLPDINSHATSRSLVPLFNSAVAEHWGDDVVFAEQEETRVIRTPKYVLFKRYNGYNNQGITDELYDIEQDPDESCNLSGKPSMLSVERELNDKLRQYFSSNVNTEADLWHGGVPIQNSMRSAFWQGVWGEQWQPVYSYSR